MKMKKMKLFISILFLFTGMFCININDVKAATLENSDGGYAKCTYRVETSTDRGTSLINKMFNQLNYIGWQFTYLAYCGDSEVYKDGERCGYAIINVSNTSPGIIGTDGPPEYLYDKLNAYTGGIETNKIFANNFVDSQGNFQCPQTIVVNGYETLSIGTGSSDDSFQAYIETQSVTNTPRNGSIYLEKYGVMGATAHSDDFINGGQNSGTGSSQNTYNNGTSGVVEGKDMFDDANGDGYSLESMLGTVFRVMQIGGILILIILSVLDTAKAITSGEDDRLKKISGKIVKRLIALAILLLLPVIINLIVDILVVAGVTEVAGIDLTQFSF